jgi:hypothetical protein
MIFLKTAMRISHNAKGTSYFFATGLALAHLTSIMIDSALRSDMRCWLIVWLLSCLGFPPLLGGWLWCFQKRGPRKRQLSWRKS